MNKKILFGSLVLCCLLVFYFFSTKNNEKKLPEIRIGYSAPEELAYGPVIIAREKDYYKEQGINAIFIPLQTSSEVRQALSTGTIDVGLINFSNLLLPLSKNAPIKVIAPLGRQPLYLFVKPNSGINTIKDLEGKRIESITGAAPHLIIADAMLKGGANPKTIQLIQIDEISLPLALMKGATDVAPDSIYHEVEFQKAGASQLKEWDDKGYTDLPDQISASNFNTIIAVNTQYLKKNKSILEKFFRGVTSGRELTKNNPVEAAQALADSQKKTSNGAIIMDPEYIQKLWQENKLQYMSWYDLTKLIDIVDTASKIGTIEKSLTANDIFDFSFEKYLKDEQEKIYK